MPEDTVFDSTDKGTLRPNAKPLRKKGDAFTPMQLPNWSWEINVTTRYTGKSQVDKVRILKNSKLRRKEV
jgi:hypothetical protein